MDRWDVSESQRRQMVEVARQFRKHPTATEESLWRLLRGRHVDGVKFRRQQNIGPFVVDFYVPEHRLVVEVDGPVHDAQQDADRRRQQLLESLGLRFVRVPAAQVETDLTGTLAAIRAGFTPHPSAPSPTRGEGAEG